MNWSDLTPAQLISAVVAKCEITATGCWEWQGARNTLDYGQVVINDKRIMVHRLMYWTGVKDFDKSLDVCHTCDNPPCCNPAHLWIGDPKTNSRDCVQKGRHYKASNTHCPRGHSYAEHGVRHGKQKWRHCRVCILGRSRVAQGWPEDLAYSLPKVPHGMSVFRGLKKPTLKGTKGKGTHCRRGHALEGDNIYKKPGGGRQCKICHHAAVAAWLKRGKVAIMNKATHSNG